MDISSRLVFDADPKTVAAMLVDRSFLEELARDVDALDSQIEVQGNFTRVTMRVPAPDMARSFVGATLPVEQTVDWGDIRDDGTRHGTFKTTCPGLPMDLSGTADITAEGAQTVVTYQGTFEVTVPFIGKQIEAQAAPMVREAIDAQQQVGTSWLAAHKR